MTPNILVVYASKAGSTADVAEMIGQALRRAGAIVDVKPARDAAHLEGYTAVVAGTGIRAGQLYPEITAFVRLFRGKLEKMPVAYFVVCLTMSRDTPEHRRTVEAYLDPLKAEVKPVDIGLFAGKMDYSKLGFLPRFIIKTAMKIPEADHRNRAAIEAWALQLLPKLRS